MALKEFILNDNVNALMANYDNSPIELDAQNEAAEYFEADDAVPTKKEKSKKNKKPESEKKDDDSYSEFEEDYTEIKVDKER